VNKSCLFFFFGMNIRSARKAFVVVGSVRRASRCADHPVQLQHESHDTANGLVSGEHCFCRLGVAYK
jgi:hypothetical protein